MKTKKQLFKEAMKGSDPKYKLTKKQIAELNSEVSKAYAELTERERIKVEGKSLWNAMSLEEKVENLNERLQVLSRTFGPTLYR